MVVLSPVGGVVVGGTIGDSSAAVVVVVDVGVLGVEGGIVDGGIVAPVVVVVPVEGIVVPEGVVVPVDGVVVPVEGVVGLGVVVVVVLVVGAVCELGVVTVELVDDEPPVPVAAGVLPFAGGEVPARGVSANDRPAMDIVAIMVALTSKSF